jgi:hypothetical protein
VGGAFFSRDLGYGSFVAQPLRCLAGIQIELFVATLLNTICQLLQQHLSLRGMDVQTKQAWVITKLKPEGVSH